MLIRALIAATASSLLVGGFIGMPPAQSAQTARLPVPALAPGPINDVDGDGAVDLVSIDHGNIEEDGDGPDRPGSVQVVLGNGMIQKVTTDELGYPIDVDSKFGSAVLVADLNTDGYADVVTSDPEWSRSAGRVFALYGGPDGITATRTVALAIGPPGVRLGLSLALLSVPSRVLAVGSNARSGGSVHLFPVNTDGTLGAAKIVSSATSGVPGTASRGDRFGASLAASGNALVVGVPGSHHQAGAVVIFRMLSGGRFVARRISQNTPGVPGASEKGDLFGSSVSIRGRWVAIGVEEEAEGAVKAAGRVHVLKLSGEPGRLAFSASRAINQNTRGVPGRVGAWDRFGLKVRLFRPCADAIGVAVLLEEGGRRAAVEAVTVSGSCASRWVARPGEDTHDFMDFAIQHGATNSPVDTVLVARESSQVTSITQTGRFTVSYAEMGIARIDLLADSFG